MNSIEIIKPIVNVINFNNIVNKTEKYPCAKIMEFVCRVCYNSYDKISENSYIKLLSSAANKGHRSIFEFSNVEFIFYYDKNYFGKDVIKNYNLLKKQIFLNTTILSNDAIRVNGSIKAFLEFLENEYLCENNNNDEYIFKHIYSLLLNNFSYIITNWKTYKELQYFYSLCGNEYSRATFTDITLDINNVKDKIRRKILVELVTDRGLHNELVRHRMCSHMAESQRYVKYGTEKNPLKLCVDSIRYVDESFCNSLKEFGNIALNQYLNFIDNNYPPQISRAALPMSTSVKSFTYCNMEEWEHIFRQRCSSKALPMAQEVTKEIFQQFVNKCIY